MQEVLIFSGTSEGRRLAEQLSESGVCVTVCVATEYGREVIGKQEKHPQIQVRTGRMDVSQMQQLIGKKPWDAVVDATHPFASEATRNIEKACKMSNRQVMRLLREEGPDMEELAKRGEVPAKMIFVNSVPEAVHYLNQSTGNILFTTGSKDLPEYLAGIQDISRVYVRILPSGREVDRCRSLGLTGRQLICMQGPFSTALNAAMLRQIEAAVLVTKETALAGGYVQKLAAAAQTGAEAVVIRRPLEKGYTMNEILQKLGLERETQKARRITLVGMGMGDLSNMTQEAYGACQKADLIIGAKRMLKTVEGLGKPMKNLYRSGEIAEFVKEHPNYQEIVILLSGDVGFYSGAKKLLEEEFLQQDAQSGKSYENQRQDGRRGESELALQESKTAVYQIRRICGVPTVAYFASRLGIPWEDLALVSLHGRRRNFIGMLHSHGKLFALMDGAQGVCRLAAELLEYGFAQTKMFAGSSLSYPQEEICEGTPKDFLDYRKEGPCAVILLAKQTEGRAFSMSIPDAEFLRGEVPMTKEEVRSVSLSKLALEREAVVYDVGAGTGSVSVECARQAFEGRVYAIEKNPRALELLQKNKFKHRAWNMDIIAKEAPEAFEGLPVPTHAFVGGSGGKLQEIVEALWNLNAHVRLVCNIVSLETLKELMDLLEKRQFSQKEMVQVSVAKAKQLGNHHLMLGQNPVYIITLQK